MSNEGLLDTLTIDAHIDAPWINTKWGGFDPTEDSLHGQVDFPRMKQGGLDAAIFALYLSDAMQDQLGVNDSWDRLLEQIDWITRLPGYVIEPWHIEECVKSGYTPIFSGLEGARVLNGSLRKLEVLIRAGIKYLGPVHNRSNALAGSATDSLSHRREGLTDLGRVMLEFASDKGILIDISHACCKTVYDILDVTDGVIASHSGCASLVKHPRNLPDDLIRKVAAVNGIICIPFARKFVGDDYQNIADHIDYIAQLVGIKAVGIGSDLDGAIMVDGVKDVSNWRAVIEEPLSKRGYSNEDIQAVLGGNLMRMLSL